jgi:sulfite exporter TauE/SafE
VSASDFYLVLVLGFVSSLHCAQMCGPVVLTYSVAANTGAARKPLLGLHLAYNAGRTLTYMMVGAIAGLAGGAMGWAGQLAGFENTAAIVAGSAMMITGIAMFGVGFRKWRGFALPVRLLRPAGKLISSSSTASKFGLGLIMGFLPCGLVYAAMMKAVGTGTALGGALTLFGFGLGTSGALILIGVGSSTATRRIARWGTAISAATVLAMGAILIVRGATAGPADHCHSHHLLS